MPRTPNPAPHGRDENGTPLAPYGLNTDGTPRKSNRGRRATPGVRPPAGPTTVKKSATDTQRKSMLVELADMFIATPLAGLSRSPRIAKRLGRHADALAGDAFILSQYAPGVADGLIYLSKTKPGALAWLDKTEENAPWLLLAQVGVQMAKALIENHLAPRADLADAGRNLVSIRMAQMAAAVNAEADRIARQAATSQGPDVPAFDEPTYEFAAA